MTDSALISVVLPTYDAGKYLRPSVLSILRQTYQNWEMLIIDDCSQDNALDSIRDISDMRIRIIRNNLNEGVTVRLNQGIALARGQFLARMDQDDVSHPMRLELQLAFLMRNPDVDLLATKCLAINHENTIVGLISPKLMHEAICSRVWSSINMPHPSWMGKTIWFKRFMYAVPGPFFCDDQELLLRAHKESRYACLDSALLAYRIRNQVNLKKNLITRLAILKIQLKAFHKSRHWFFFCMAIINFFVKSGYDLCRVIFKKSPVSTSNYFPDKLHVDWEDVFREIKS